MSILLSGFFHSNSQAELLFLEKEFLLELYTQKLLSEIKFHIIPDYAGFIRQGYKGKEGIKRRIYGTF